MRLLVPESGPVIFVAPGQRTVGLDPLLHRVLSNSRDLEGKRLGRVTHHGGVAALVKGHSADEC
mgnify:FL=1